MQDHFLDLEKSGTGDVGEDAVREFHGVLREGEVDGARGGEGCEIGRIDAEGFAAGFAVYEKERWGWGVGSPGYGGVGATTNNGFSVA